MVVCFHRMVSSLEYWHFCIAKILTHHHNQLPMALCHNSSWYVPIVHVMSQQFMLCHNSTCYATTVHVMPQQFMLWHNMITVYMLCHNSSCYVTTAHVMSQQFMLCHTSSCYVTTVHVMSQQLMLCHNSSCYVTTVHVMSQQFMLCHNSSCVWRNHQKWKSWAHTTILAAIFSHLTAKQLWPVTLALQIVSKLHYKFGGKIFLNKS